MQIWTFGQVLKQQVSKIDEIYNSSHYHNYRFVEFWAEISLSFLEPWVFWGLSFFENVKRKPVIALMGTGGTKAINYRVVFGIDIRAAEEIPAVTLNQSYAFIF